MKLLNTSLKSWLKNLLIEYIYAEQNPNRTWDIWFQSWPFRSEKRIANSTKFSLWRPVPGKWAATWGFMVWLFLSWGIDYQIKNKKTQSGRITFWIFCHPISHCVLVLQDNWTFEHKVQYMATPGSNFQASHFS